MRSGRCAHVERSSPVYACTRAHCRRREALEPPRWAASPLEPQPRCACCVCVCVCVFCKMCRSPGMRNDQCAHIEPASPVYASARALPQMERGIGATEMVSGAAAQVTLSPPAHPFPTPSAPCTWSIYDSCVRVSRRTHPRFATLRCSAPSTAPSMSVRRWRWQ